MLRQGLKPHLGVERWVTISDHHCDGSVFQLIQTVIDQFLADAFPLVFRTDCHRGKHINRDRLVKSKTSKEDCADDGFIFTCTETNYFLIVDSRR